MGSRNIRRMTYNTKTKRKRTNDKELSTKHYTTKIKIVWLLKDTNIMQCGKCVKHQY